ncbi:hypothetical protein ABZ960_02150 [Streptomyces pseudovenezuelae]|uniref:hypothetical protein n=1 Tax=Streptomyces TaxID=1883 RepID=UPI001CED6207
MGNWALSRQSHYWIHDGCIRWSRRDSAADVAENRERGSRLLAQGTEELRPGPLTRPRRHLQSWR